MNAIEEEGVQQCAAECRDQRSNHALKPDRGTHFRRSEPARNAALRDECADLSGEDLRHGHVLGELDKRTQGKR